MSDQVLGRLPDVFLKADGSRVQSTGEWREQRARLKTSRPVTGRVDTLMTSRHSRC